MITKVFFENKPVFLTDELSSFIKEYIGQTDTIYIEEISPRTIDSLCDKIKKPAFARAVLYNDTKDIKQAFFKYFDVIQAAGGLVKNEAGDVLFIFRRGKWDLPKGKNEGEDAKDCALREVKEETGLMKVEIGKHIATTYHVYKQFAKHLLKQTEWFDMKSSSQEKLIPQQEEDIEKIEWVDQNNISHKLENSYALIADVLVSAGFNNHNLFKTSAGRN